MGFVSLVTGLLRPRTALVLLALVGAWEAYVWLRPAGEGGLDEARQQMASEACWRVVEKLPSLPEGAVLAVAPLAGDTGGHVTKQLRTFLFRSGHVVMPEEGLLDRIRRELGFSESAPPDRDAAVELARRAGATHVLTGRVADFGTIRDEGRIDLRLQVVPVAGGESTSLAVRLPDSAEARRWSTRIWAIVGWIAGALALPLVCWPVVKAVLEKESNAATLGLLVGLSVLAAGGAMWLWDVGTGWIAAVAVPVAFLASITYNYIIFAGIEASRR